MPTPRKSPIWTFTNDTQRDTFGAVQGVESGDVCYVILTRTFCEFDGSVWVSLGAASYYIDFRAQPTLSPIVNGANVIDGKVWTAANAAAATTFQVLNGTGLQIINSTANTDFLASGGSSCPLIRVPVLSLLPDWNIWRTLRIWMRVASVATANADFESFGLALRHSNAKPPTGGVERSVGMGRGFNSGVGGAGWVAFREGGFFWFANGNTTDLTIGFDYTPSEIQGWSSPSVPPTEADINPRGNFQSLTNSGGDAIQDVPWAAGMELVIYSATNNGLGSLNLTVEQLALQVLV